MSGAVVWGAIAVVTALACLVVAVVATVALIDRGDVRRRIVAGYPLRTVTALLLTPAAALCLLGILFSTAEGVGGLVWLVLVAGPALGGCIAMQVVAHLAVKRGLGEWRWMIPLVGLVLPTILGVFYLREPLVTAWLLAYALACGGNGALLAWRGAREKTAATTR